MIRGVCGVGQRARQPAWPQVEQGPVLAGVLHFSPFPASVWRPAAASTQRAGRLPTQPPEPPSMAQMGGIIELEDGRYQVGPGAGRTARWRAPRSGVVAPSPRPPRRWGSHGGS